MSNSVLNEEKAQQQQIVHLSEWEETAVRFRPNFVRFVAARSKYLVGACIAVAYASVVGAIVSSHCGVLSFAAFRSMLPLAVALVDAMFYAVVLNNAMASPTTHRRFIGPARFLVEMTLAAIAWSAGEFMGPIVGIHVATLFRDAAVVVTVVAYAEMPRSFADAARIDSSDTIEIKLAMLAYAVLSAVLAVVLPFVIPGRWMAVLASVIHFSAAGSAFLTSVRFRHDLFICGLHTVGALSNCLAMVAIVLSGSDITLATIFAWILGIHALLFMFLPAIRSGSGLMKDGSR